MCGAESSLSMKRTMSCFKAVVAGSSLLAISAFVGVGTSEAGERRVAFVIGNSDYSSVPKLPNPRNDAEAVAKALKRSGFEVVTAIDLDRAQLDAAFTKFVRSMNQADLSLFYYSGHGIEVGGDNRIIPVDAHLKSATDLEVETVSVETVMSYMQKNSKVQLVYLDSCRNNPFPSQSFLVGPDKQTAVAGVGLAPQISDLGSLVAFSTLPGEVAVDGTGDKSPFTDAMVKQSFKLGVDVQTALTRVTQDVYAATNQQQKPWSSSTLPDPVFLAKPLIRISAAPSTLASSSGFKVGTAKSQDVAVTEQAPATDQVAALFGTSLAQPQRVAIGVGPVALLGDLPIVRAAPAVQVEVSAVPSSGVMYVDGKPLGEGDVIDAPSLRKVTYEPSIGSDGATQTVQFKVMQNGAAAPELVTANMQPYVHKCDWEAAEPLDLQGVATGKLLSDMDARLAVESCQKAIEAYPSESRYIYLLGRAKLAANDPAGARELFKKAADKGYKRAFAQLGDMAQQGLGQAQNLQEANLLLKTAAEAGDPRGMLLYARNLVKGSGTDRNVGEGVRLLNKAIEVGDTEAMNELGDMYATGRGVGKNQQRGLRFYEASLARGDRYAMRKIVEADAGKEEASVPEEQQAEPAKKKSAAAVKKVKRAAVVKPVKLYKPKPKPVVKVAKPIRKAKVAQPVTAGCKGGKAENGRCVYPVRRKWSNEQAGKSKHDAPDRKKGGDNSTGGYNSTGGTSTGGNTSTGGGTSSNPGGWGG